MQTIAMQHQRRAAQAALMVWSMQGWHRVPSSGSRSQKTPHEAGRGIDLSCTSLRFGLPADAVELPAGVELATDIVRVPAALLALGFGILERSVGVGIQPCPNVSADPASLRTLHPVAFLLLDLRRLAGCGHQH